MDKKNPSTTGTPKKVKAKRFSSDNNSPKFLKSSSNSDVNILYQPISKKEKVEKRRAFIINAFYIIIIGAIIFALFKYAFPLLLPFIIGLIISLMLLPAIKFITKRTKLNKKVVSAIVLVLGYGIIVLAVTLLGFKVVSSLSNLFSSLPSFYNDSIKSTLIKLNDKIIDIFKFVSPEIESGADSMLIQVTEQVQKYLISLSSTAVSKLGSLTTKLPSFFIAFIFSIMFSVLITMNYEQILAFARRQVPAKHQKFVDSVKTNTVGAVFKYLRAYAIILSITFLELSLGLTILGVKNSILIAFGIALFDIFPFLGTGGIIIPWALFSFLNESYFLGIGLLIIYVIILVVRQIIEPRIVGDQLGLNPIVALISMYIGFKTLGLFGMIIVPIIAQIVISLHDEGLIKLWHK